ncbi:MAG: UTP--glucose-1-phosphate uridylyltransferase GalU [Clostridiales bacterium]|jgi:UTP--glucose-1-phosphate uridylyltransferase|nr:UTP--glucose-1-phosphate uridylyltransferase GalU [Clostridiales bacterium]
MQKVTKAVIPAAGLGTRFLPATKAVPKEMLPVIDIPTIQLIVEEAVASGITDILIISGRTKKAIEDHFDKSYELETELENSGKTEMLQELQAISNLANIHYIRQKEMKGLGNAILYAKSFVGNEPFAIMLGDDVVYTNNQETPCLKQLIDVYDNSGVSVLGVQEVARENVNKYGIVDGKLIEPSIYSVDSLVEKPSVDAAPSNVAILGRYVINPEVFSILEETKPGSGGEIQLTDALNTLAKSEKMKAYIFNGRRYDLGNKQEFIQAIVEYALRRDDLKDDFLKFLKQTIYDINK